MESRASSPCPRFCEGAQQQEEVLGQLLGQGLVDHLKVSGKASQAALASLEALGQQSVTMGIDYHTLGHSSNHPKTRLQYRQCSHPSTACHASRQRAETSRQRLQDLAISIANGSVNAEVAIVRTFLLEIGAPTSWPLTKSATFSGVSAALDAELLLPLRALLEGQHYMHRTFSGEPVPASAVASALHNVVAATLSKPGGLSEWRYSNPTGAEQLRGLSRNQGEKWMEPTSFVHVGGLKTREDGDLGLFWATKIGGPSHGFDIGGQCLLPLLANARNKVLLVTDPAWPAYPVGRAHFRMLWTASCFAAPAPRLWLEAVNCDFDAASSVDRPAMTKAVLRHAVEKADAMGVPLSVDKLLLHHLSDVVKERAAVKSSCSVELVCEQLTLRPSNGVCEASDFLSKRHDWVQLHEEDTEPIPRALYVPAQC
jgi:hypothetical protein